MRLPTYLIGSFAHPKKKGGLSCETHLDLKKKNNNIAFLSINLSSFQLEVASLVSTERIRSMAEQFIYFNRTSTVSPRQLSLVSSSDTGNCLHAGAIKKGEEGMLAEEFLDIMMQKFFHMLFPPTVRNWYYKGFITND